MGEKRTTTGTGTKGGSGVVGPVVAVPGRKPRRTKVGRVVSNKMDKTAVVAVDNLVRHRLYGRTVRRTKKFKAHDADNSCQIGDVVVIAESRPLSKDKHWIVAQILRRGTGEPVELAEMAG